MSGFMDTVASFAPAVGAALGGPLGGLAGNFVAQYFGVDKDKLVEVLSSGDPEVQAKKANMDHAFRMHLLDLGIQEEAIHSADRASAREREKAIGGWSNPILAAIVIGGFLYCVVAVLGGFVQGMTDPNTAGTIGALIGYMSAKADQVVSYYFGSSKGHDDSLKRGLK
jgi:hypothetical protein